MLSTHPSCYAGRRGPAPEASAEEGQMDNDVVQPSSSALSRRFLAWTSKGIAAGTLSLPLLLEACAPAAPPAGSGAPPPAAPTSAPAAPATAAAQAPPTAAPKPTAAPTGAPAPASAPSGT